MATPTLVYVKNAYRAAHSSTVPTMIERYSWLTVTPPSRSGRIVSTRPPRVPRAPGLLQQPCRQLGALHPVPDALRVPAVARAAHPRVPRARPRQARRQARGLVLVQLGRRLAEVAAA